MNILITAGGTIEPIDAVRVISNSSTGRTGAFLADFFAEKGADVTLLRANNAIPATHRQIQTHLFTTTQSYQQALCGLLEERSFDMLIHAAAISDYHVAAIRVADKEYAPSTDVKLPTSNAIELKLERNPKLINMVKRMAQNPGMLLVGFKLTQGASDAEAQDKIQQLFAASRADYVVHNDLASITEQWHPFRILSQQGEIAHGTSKHDMATALFRLVEKINAPCA